MKFEYYYDKQADMFAYVRFPRVMLIGKEFADLSLQAKVLYGLLLDRMGLSMKNGWLDELKRVYIIYQVSELQEDLNMSKKKIIDYLNELEEYGLIEKKRRGLGLASHIYVKSFMVKSDELETSRGVKMGTSGEDDCKNNFEAKEENVAENVQISEEKHDNYSRSAELGTSRSVEMGTSGGVDLGTSRGVVEEPQEVPELAPQSNNKLNNNKYINNSNHISSVSEKEMRSDEAERYAKVIRKNLELDVMVQDHPNDKEKIEGIFDLVLETVLCKSDTILIASNKYPAEMVKSKFLKLDCTHLEYVLNCLKKNTTKVKNIKKYILATLFNAPSTMDGYYLAEVRHDMYGA